MNQPTEKTRVVPSKLLVPFILVTVLFPLWGFANDITNPMVAAFKNILLLSNFESSLVQAAFYGGYALMAIPAALFIKRFSYRSGILLGLGLYAVGCLLFIPSGGTLAFAPFLLSYLIMTCGLSFLETTANPYILALGPEETATRRLNLSQAFNPMGSITGMFVASMFILINLDGTTEAGRRAMDAVNEGKLVHEQLVKSVKDSGEKLAEIVSAEGWTEDKKAVKAANELAGKQAIDTAILADPKVADARRLKEAIGKQESDNRFVEAGHAVAVVLQIREKEEPTAAEKEVSEDFGGGSGHELALQLADELDVPAIAEARQSVVASLTTGASAAEALKTAVEGKDAAVAAAQVAAMNEAFSDVNAFGSVSAESVAGYRKEIEDQFRSIQQKDLDTVVGPYAIMGVFLLVMLGLFAWKLPKGTEQEESAGSGSESGVGSTIKRLCGNWNYLGGIIAQTFYVGAQIMCWTFIIQYAEAELGLAKSTAQNCNILAMLIFVSSRFICTFFLKYIRPGSLLFVLAVGGIVFTLGTIFIQGYPGLYCLIGVSACMSLMFPTIYGIALDGLGEDAKLGSAGLILAIGGGCIMVPLQALIIDQPAFSFGSMELSSVRASFSLPVLCFVVIAIYGFACSSLQAKKKRIIEGEGYSA